MVGTIDTAVFGIYLAGILGIGVYFWSRTEDFEDYTLAGRRIPWFILVTTMAAGYFGGGASVGLVGRGYNSGLMIWAAWFVAIGIIGSLVAWYVAPKLRETEGYSVADIYANNYGLAGGYFAGIMSFLVTVGILGAQVVALGAIISVILGTSLEVGMVLGMLVVIVYSTVGGRAAVIHTDVLQFLILMSFFSVIAVWSLWQVGGFAGLYQQLPSTDYISVTGTETWGTVVTLAIVFGFGESLVPAYTQTFLSAKDAAHSRLGTTAGRLVGPLFFIFPIVIGMCAQVLLDRQIPAGDEVLPVFINEFLPVGLAGLLLAALVAAIMSTADSYLNSAATVLYRDLVEPTHELSDRGRLRFTVAASLVIGIASLAFGLLVPNVIDALIVAYYFWAPTVWVPVVAGALMDDVSPYAGLSSGFAGLVTVAIWRFSLNQPYGLGGIAPGLIACLVVFLLVHVLTKDIPERTGFRPQPIRE